MVNALASHAPALSFALPALVVALLVSLARSAAPSSGGVSGTVAGAVLAAAVVAAALSLAGLGSWSVPAAGVAEPVAELLIGRYGANAA